MGPAQQVEQGLVVILFGDLQRFAALFDFAFEVFALEPFGQHRAVGQFVNDTRVLQQVTGRPFGIAQQTQQTLVYGRAFEQQRQITFAA